MIDFPLQIGLGVFFKLKDGGHPIEGFLNYLPLISLILFIFCFSAGKYLPQNPYLPNRSVTQLITQIIFHELKTTLLVPTTL